jgi:hypothetical protein
MNPRKTLEQWAFFLSYMGARLPALTEAQKTKYRAAVRTVCVAAGRSWLLLSFSDLRFRRFRGRCAICP